MFWLCLELLVSKITFCGSWSQKFKFMECFQESVSLEFPCFLPCPCFTQPRGEINGGTATCFLWACTHWVEPVDGGILAGAEEHSCHVWVIFYNLDFALQLAVRSCHVQTDCLHQSRLMYMPREICFHLHLSNVTCVTARRRQPCHGVMLVGSATAIGSFWWRYSLGPWDVWIHFLALSLTSLGFLWVLSLH